MEKPENKATSMDDLIEIYKCVGCPPTLAANFAHVNMFSLNQTNYMMDKEPESLDIDLKNLAKNSSAFLGNIGEDQINDFIETFQHLNIYDSTYENLADRYLSPAPIKKELRSMLNYAAYTYLGLNGPIWLKKILPVIEQDIEKLVTATERFKYSLNPITEWGDDYNLFFDNEPIQKMLRETQENLDKILTLKEKFRSSTLANLAKLDDHRPMGNPGLHEFIKIMWIFWHDLLGRTTIQKHDEINGRKQFLEFLIECLEPIHPTLVEGGMVDGTVDNALKKFQKNLKSEES